LIRRNESSLPKKGGMAWGHGKNEIIAARRARGTQEGSRLVEVAKEKRKK